MPVHAQMRCFTRTFFVISASPSLKLGKSSVTGWSQRIFFSSTSFASSIVVMPLVLEAAMKSVLASIGPGLPSSRTPRPPS